MKVTWEEAYQIAGEIVDVISENEIILKNIGGQDAVERVATIIYSHDGFWWRSYFQDWFKRVGKRGNIHEQADA